MNMARKEFTTSLDDHTWIKKTNFGDRFQKVLPQASKLDNSSQNINFGSG